MTSPSPPDRARDNQRNTEPAGGGAARRARYVDERVSPLALRREPVRSRDPARGRRRRRARRALRADPAALPGSRRRRARRLLVARGRAVGHPAQGLLPEAGCGDLRRGRRRGLAVLDGGLQRQVDRRGHQVHGLEDPGTAAGEALRPARTPAAASPANAVDAALARRATASPSSPPGSTTFPVDQWTNSYTPEYLRWRLACPSTTVRAPHHRRPRRGVHHRHPFRCPRRGHPEAAAAE